MTRLVSCGLMSILVVSTIAMAASAQSTTRIVTRPDGSVTRATQWVDAVLAHTPGSTDAAVSHVGGWTTAEVTDLLIELSSIRLLRRNPYTKFFPLPIEFDRSRGADTEIRYSADERRALEAAVARVERRGLTDVDLVARGIVLHTDIAVLGNGSGTIVNFADGQGLDERHDVDHWFMARRLADTLDAKAGRNADIALWYRATLSHMASIQMWNAAHAERALERFGDDADLRFLAGCLHEMLAAARTQAFVANSTLPSGRGIRVDSADDELRNAASLLKRAIELNPRRNELRLHYGRVLTLLDRAALAIPELRRATEETEPVQQYYAQLFLGAALEATDQRDAARAAYRRAAALFPPAQSPQLALSQLASSAGSPLEAAEALDAVFALPAPEQDRPDPWWTYFASSGRDAADLMNRARQRLSAARNSATQ